MKTFVVLVGVLALLAFSQAQSDEVESATASEEEEESSPAPPAPRPPGPPGHPGHHEKPSHEQPPQKPLQVHRPRPKPGFQFGPDGFSFNAPGISINIASPFRGKQEPEPKPQQAENDDSERIPPSHRPLRFPVYLDSNLRDNRIEGDVEIA